MLDELQKFVVKTIKRDEFFARASVLATNDTDIATQITQAINSLGLLILVRTPFARVEGSNAPGPLYRPVVVHVDVQEMVLTNRTSRGTNVPAPTWAERVAWQLHWPNHAGDTDRQADDFRFTADTIGEVPDKQFLKYRVVLTTRGAGAGIVTEDN